MSPGGTHCVMLLGKTLQLSVFLDTDEFNALSIPVMDLRPIQRADKTIIQLPHTWLNEPETRCLICLYTMYTCTSSEAEVTAF